MLTPSSLPPTTLTNAFCWVHCLLVLASLPQPVQDSAMITVPCNTWLLSSAFSSLGHSLYARSWQHFLAFPEKEKKKLFGRCSGSDFLHRALMCEKKKQNNVFSWHPGTLFDPIHHFHSAALPLHWTPQGQRFAYFYIPNVSNGPGKQ